MKFNKKYLVVLFNVMFILGVLNSGELPAAVGDADMKAMQRDINIMKGILEQLLLNKSSHFESKTQGMYLEGYGVIFNISYGSLGSYMISIHKSSEEEEAEGTHLYSRVLDDFADREKPEEVVANLKKGLQSFFGDYVSAMKELQPGDKITVVVEFNGDEEPIYINLSGESTYVRRLIATVNMDDVASYRKNSISRAQFEKKLMFQEVKSNEEQKRDIGILANIFNSAMRINRSGNVFFSGSKYRSMYFPGFGAVFMADTDIRTNLIISMEDIEWKQNEVVEITAGSKSDSKTKHEELREVMKTYRENIIDILGRYGGSLRSVPENEFVLIAVDLGSPFHDELSKVLYIKAKMNDIKRYNREQLSFDRFKNAVQVIEY